MSPTESAAFFTQTWSLYDHIAEYNYMHHREIHAGIAEQLNRRQDSNRYALLDLGCGNARFMAPCLKHTPPARYEGVDLSESALEEARGNFAELSFPVNLKHGEMLQAVESTDQRWDVIYSGFALHHLSAREKARFFQAVARCLTDKGWLFLVDVVRNEDQSREEYLKDYLRLMRDEWTQMPRDQLETACTHVANHDYPENLSTLQGMAAESGLEECRVLAHYGPHYSLLFSRVN